MKKHLDPNRGNDWFPLPFLQTLQCTGMQHPASWLKFPETAHYINKKIDDFLMILGLSMQKLPVSQHHFTEGFTLILFSLSLDSCRGMQTHNGKKKKKRGNNPHPQKCLLPHIWSFLSLKIVHVGSHGWEQGSCRHTLSGRKNLEGSSLDNCELPLLTRNL